MKKKYKILIGILIVIIVIISSLAYYLKPLGGSGGRGENSYLE